MGFSTRSILSAVCAIALPMSFGALANSNANSTSPKINFKITDHDGSDVTSSFKIMLYEQSKSKGTGNLNDRQVPFVRPINTCNDREGIFVDSSCNHKELDQGSLQAYTYRCLSYIRDQAPARYSRRVILPFTGACDEDEVCVNGRGENELRNEQADVAHCVKSNVYTEISNATDPTPLEKESDDWRIGAILSNRDEKTTMKADSIDLEAVQSTLGGGQGSRQSKSCIDCVDLTSDKLAPKMDVLETDVKLLSVGTVAAGILWLTMLSG